MIVADISAPVAVVIGEPERAAFLQALQPARRVLISSGSVVEAGMMANGPSGRRALVLLDDLLRMPMFEIAPPSAAETDAAYAALIAFGKGCDYCETEIVSDVPG